VYLPIITDSAKDAPQHTNTPKNTQTQTHKPAYVYLPIMTALAPMEMAFMMCPGERIPPSAMHGMSNCRAKRDT